MITALPRIAIAMNDFEGALDTFGRQLGMPVVDHSHHTVPALGAHVAMCAPAVGSNIELMSPSDPDAPLSQALQAFLNRRGDGLYALMLEAPVPDEEAVGLAARGLDVMPLMPGAHGRDVHPRSTHGVLIRVYPNDSAPPPPGLVSEAPNLTGITRAVVGVTDASLAATAYGHGFGLPVGPVVNDPERGVDAVVVTPPKGGVIELVSVADTTRPFARDIQSFLKERNHGLFALVLEADDPAAATATLRERGVAEGHTETPTFELYGARFIIA